MEKVHLCVGGMVEHVLCAFCCCRGYDFSGGLLVDNEYFIEKSVLEAWDSAVWMYPGTSLPA